MSPSVLLMIMKRPMGTPPSFNTAISCLLSLRIAIYVCDRFNYGRDSGYWVSGIGSREGRGLSPSPLPSPAVGEGIKMRIVDCHASRGSARNDFFPDA